MHKGKAKKKERGRKEKRKSNGCTLSFYNGYFGDFWPKKQLLAVTFSKIQLDVFFEVYR